MWIAIRGVLGSLMVLGSLRNLLDVGKLENEVQMASYLFVTFIFFVIGAGLIWWAYDSYKSQNVD